MTAPLPYWFFPTEGRAVPLAHSHNDYDQTVPLTGALGTSPPCEAVEVDVFIVGGVLKVGHDLTAATNGPTADTQYWGPLLTQRPKQYVLVDMKDSPSQTAFNRLLVELAARPSLATLGIQFVISGNRPADISAAPQHVVLDGRYTAADLATDPKGMPLISIDWTSLFTWNGTGTIPPGERATLHEVAHVVRRAGKQLRFFATADTTAMWDQLRAAGVDIVNADALSALAAWRSSL